MAIALLEAGNMARIGSGGDDGAPMGETTGGTKSMRAQKLQLNRDKSEPWYVDFMKLCNQEIIFF